VIWKLSLSFRKSLAALVLFVPLGCDETPAYNSSSQVDASGGVCPDQGAHQVRYILDWDWGMAQAASSTQGFRLVNDLGFEIEVEKAYLNSYRTGLVACEESELLEASRTDPFKACVSETSTWSLMSIAHAGHSYEDGDPVVFTQGLVENFAQPKSIELASISVSDQKYCKLHYLIAKAKRDSLSLPSDVAMVDSTIYMSGSFVAPGDEESHSFEFLSSLADGVLSDFETTLINVDFQGADIHIVRKLDLIFDGINLTELSDEEVAQSVLANIVSNTQIENRPIY
jgi:hypothetical protein